MHSSTAVRLAQPLEYDNGGDTIFPSLRGENVQRGIFNHLHNSKDLQMPIDAFNGEVAIKRWEMALRRGRFETSRHEQPPQLLPDV